jgi:hypothetical protein
MMSATQAGRAFCEREGVSRTALKKKKLNWTKLVDMYEMFYRTTGLQD